MFRMKNRTNGDARKLLVVHVSLCLDTGGLERLLVEFARHADRDRFDLRFLSMSSRGRVSDELEALGWPVTALEEPPGRRPGLVLRIARLFRRWDAGVVHTHNNGPLIYGASAARIARVGRVFNTRHYGQYLDTSRRELLAVRLASRLVDKVVCVSDDSALVAARDGISPGKLRTIWNGIDVQRFSYTGPRPDGPIVVVARLSPEKDVETLIRAVAIASDGSPPLRLEVAGDGPCRPDLERLTHDLGLSERVRFLGEVQDVPGLLARASLFVLPSRTEGISLTLLEAMARGLPVVATRVGGNSQVVVEGETGLLVPPQDPTSLAEALVRLRGSRDGMRRMGVEARRRVEALFEVRRMVSGYESLYLNQADGR
jgi:glycosyltransferase involved in cell wall biosynthesis